METYGFPITITVKKITGTCFLKHKTGDQINLNQMELEGKLCNGAMRTIYPTLYAFQWGAEFPWDKDTDKTEIPCGHWKKHGYFRTKKRQKTSLVHRKRRPRQIISIYV